MFSGQEPQAEEFTLPKCFTFVLTTISFGRRWSVTPVLTSTRITFVVMSLVGVVIQWHWKASIISKLAFNEVEIPFSNLEEMFK